LNRHRDNVDFSIVLLHDGAEHYPFPSPRLQKVCRFLVEQGAGLVVCQHSHCAGAHETYRGGHIIYGQGNLMCDWPEMYGAWHEGFLIRLVIGPNRTASWQPIPYTQSDGGPGARRMSPQREQIFLNAFDARSLAIQETGFVDRNWEEFCHARRHGIMNFILG